MESTHYKILVVDDGGNPWRKGVGGDIEKIL